MKVVSEFGYKPCWVRRMAFGGNPLGVRGLGWIPHSSAFSPSLQDPFVAFHINKGLVKKYMNSLLIGELSPEQPSFEPTKNVRLFAVWRSCGC